MYSHFFEFDERDVSVCPPTDNIYDKELDKVNSLQNILKDLHANRVVKTHYDIDYHIDYHIDDNIAMNDDDDYSYSSD